MGSKGKQKLTAAQRAQIAQAKAKAAPPPPAPSAPSPATSTSDNKPFPAWVFWVGTLLLLGAAALSLNLSLSHLGFATPGCGEGGGCDQVKQTKFAYLPFTYSNEDGRVSGWPVAYVGFAYFASMLVVWVMSSASGLNDRVRWVVRLGGAASLFYLIVMLGGYAGGVCPLCLGTHALNFALLALIEFATPTTRAHASRSLGIGLAGLIIGTGALFGVQVSRQDALDNQARQASDDLVNKIAGSNNTPSDPTPKPSEGIEPVKFDLPGPVSGDGRPGFTGRYLIGAPDAPIRIVTVAGYQCESCQIVEREIKRILEDPALDVSASMIHFPAQGACNPTLNPRVNMHPAACKTAQMAEAAGILGGPEAFWEMSFRLFEFMSQTDSLGRHPSDIPDPTVDQWAAEFGFDPVEFRRIMASEEVAHLIAEDTHLARTVGTTQTPMVFINGSEFTGWTRPGELTRTVRQLSARNLPRATSANDQPPSSAERLAEIWRKARTIPGVKSDRAWQQGGEPDAKARIVVWGCYDESNTQRADAIARQLAEQYPDASYEFRFYPFSSTCNQRVDRNIYPQACVKAKAAIAAGLLGGAEAHHAMHDWIMGQGDRFTPSQLPAQFNAIGLDPDEAARVMESSEVAGIIQMDSNTLQAMERYQIRSRPAVFVNEKPTPWIFGTDDIVLPDIVRAALGEDGD
ncbi:MAG: DsbA family protein [Phycisphaerales bacterium JB050]